MAESHPSNELLERVSDSELATIICGHVASTPNLNEMSARLFNEVYNRLKRPAHVETTQAHKPPHATVEWKYRETPDGCDYETHFDGDFKVEVCDQDGDVSYWHIWHKGKEVAKGEVPFSPGKRVEFDVAADAAIATLRAMQAERCGDDH